MMAEKTEREMQGLIVNVAGLSSRVKQLIVPVDEQKAEFATLHLQLRQANEGWEKRRQEFSATVEDQREIKKLMEDTLDVLKEVSAKPNGIPECKPSAACDEVLRQEQEKSNEIAQPRMSRSTMEAGELVRLHGLSSRPELNGSKGVLTEHQVEKKVGY